MAGARGSARRELVARLLAPRRNRRRGAGPGLGALWRALPVTLAGALTIGLALAAWPHLRDAAARHPYFAVREVVVRDHHRLPADEVRAAAGIEPGMSIWDVDAGAAEARLAAHRWIRSARVRRELPHRVVIEVRVERVRGLTLLPMRPSVPIELGWSGFGAKLARLPRVLALWAGREPEIVAVNLQFDDEVIVRTHPARAAAPARRAT